VGTRVRKGRHRRAQGSLLIRICFFLFPFGVCLPDTSSGGTTAVAGPKSPSAQAFGPADAIPDTAVFPQITVPATPERSGDQPGPAPPAVSAASGQPSSTPYLRQGPSVVLRDVRLTGNTVLAPAAIHSVVAPYLGKIVFAGDLEEIRHRITELYINRGYINSGVIIPDQNVTNGIVTFRAIEGKVTGIEVSGTNHFNPEYFRSRLAFGTEAPFNVENLSHEQQILLQDPLIRRLNLELLPGLEPGEARLHADVLEASRYSLSTQVADDQVPTVGAVRGQLQGSMGNILGFGDILAAEYGRSGGLNDGYVAYSLPIAPDDTRISLRYDRNGVVVVTPELSALNVVSSYSSIAVGLSRPIYRTPEATFLLGASLERRQQQTFLLGMPFPFTPGAEANGQTIVTPLRLYQDWLSRSADYAFAARSTLSFGLQTLGATENMTTSGIPTGKYFFWLGQTQYVQRIYKDWEMLARFDLQLAARPLFQMEQIAFGGLGSVRGYRTNLTVTDDGFLGSGELRIPVGRVRLPYLADSDIAGTVQLVPFYDYARAWNVNRPTPFPQQISGIGAGLRWYLGSGITAEFYYGKALDHVPVGNSIEDRGIYFRVTTSLF
jgi:hemolysin activation/secretion protein